MFVYAEQQQFTIMIVSFLDTIGHGILQHYVNGELNETIEGVFESGLLAQDSSS